MCADFTRAHETSRGLSSVYLLTHRRVMALKELQESYDVNMRGYQSELAQLQSKYLQKCGACFCLCGLGIIAIDLSASPLCAFLVL